MTDLFPIRIAHLREAWEAQKAENDAYHLMMVTGDGCDLCKPGVICFWHNGVKSAWPMKVGK